MTPNRAQIAEIADLLDSGMICYFNRNTSEIESHAHEEAMDMDPELWREVIDKIKEDRRSYVRFEPMDSREYFKLMERFAFSIDDLIFREAILDRLTRKGPFRHFKVLIEQSEYRQAWFDFKSRAYVEYVERLTAIT